MLILWQLGHWMLQQYLWEPSQMNGRSAKVVMVLSLIAIDLNFKLKNIKDVIQIFYKIL